MTLQEFAERVKDCQKCALAASRTQVVFGHGNPQAEMMFVGEAPGFYEDRQNGIGTIIHSGSLLDNPSAPPTIPQGRNARHYLAPLPSETERRNFTVHLVA